MVFGDERKTEWKLIHYHAPEVVGCCDTVPQAGGGKQVSRTAAPAPGQSAGPDGAPCVDTFGQTPPPPRHPGAPWGQRQVFASGGTEERITARA